MKLILLGNSGSGKTTLSKEIITREPAARLSLDKVAFNSNVERRKLEESIANVVQFIASYDSWIIEGCYADIIEAVVKECEELIFLNPGVNACVSHCLSRPWEPEKFVSRREQDENLENLISWVRLYETRTDEYGLIRHKALYESFNGKKQEFTEVEQYKTYWRIR